MPFRLSTCLVASFRKPLCLLLLISLAGCAARVKQEVAQHHDLNTRVAQAAERSGNFSTAANIYQRILKTEPDNIKAALSLAHIYYKAAQYHKALKYFQIAAQKAPNNLVAQRGVAKTYIHLQQPQIALSVFEKALKINPFDPVALDSIGIMTDMSRAHELAQQCYLKALSKEQSSVVLNNLGLSKALSRDYVAAIRNLDSAIALGDPTNKASHNVLLVKDFRTKHQRLEKQLAQLSISKNVESFDDEHLWHSKDLNVSIEDQDDPRRDILEQIHQDRDQLYTAFLQKIHPEYHLNDPLKLEVIEVANRACS